MVLRIRNWGENYETHKTRPIKNLRWVNLPNSLDSFGYCQLLEHPDGVAHFGVWCAILQIASKATPRGTLLRKDGQAHTPQSMSIVSRIPAKWFDAAIPRLLQIGWLERSDDPSATQENALPVSTPIDEPENKPVLRNSGADPENCFTDAEFPAEEPAADAQYFKDEFDWLKEHHPLAIHVDKAFRAWQTWVDAGVISKEKLPAIRAGLQRYLDSDLWARGFKASFDKFIADKMWEDEPPPSSEAVERQRGARHSASGSNPDVLWDKTW